MWWSADGSIWELVYLEDGRHTSSADDAATDGTLVVAVGSESEYTSAGALWWSPDGGRTWYRDLDLKAEFPDPMTRDGWDGWFTTVLHADGQWLIAGFAAESGLWFGTAR